MKTFLALCSLWLISFSLFAQETTFTPDTTKHAIFFELGGNGILFSINYERKIKEGEKMDINARIGLSGFPHTFAYNEFDTRMGFVIPTEVNFVFGQKKGRLETGLGYTLAQIHDIDTNLWIQTEGKEREIKTSLGHVIFPKIGYRYQNPKNGFLFKAFLLSTIPYGDIWGGISLGKAF